MKQIQWQPFKKGQITMAGLHDNPLRKGKLHIGLDLNIKDQTKDGKKKRRSPSSSGHNNKAQYTN